MGPIRKTVRIILLSLLAYAFCVTVAWADVTDPCDGPFGPGSYQNLAPPDKDYIGWDDPPDDSYLCQQSNRRAASVVYRCSNAQEVTVAIYSRHGCYAVYEDGQLVRGGDQLPLWYQTSTGEVYCDGRRMVYDAGLREFVFLDEESDPSGLVEYGLSIYCSSDGSDYHRVPIQLVSAWRKGSVSYWYEVYRADLEEGTRYLRLDLIDQSSIEIPGREERYQFETVGGLSLASVKIVEAEEKEAPASSASSAPSSEPSREQKDDDWYDWDDWYSWDDDDWEDWDDWEDNWAIWEDEEDPSVQTNSLPSYQPGEEEGPASLPWGPEEDPGNGRPAFPEEIEDREDQEPEEKTPKDASSSSGANKAASSQSSSQQKRASSQKAQSQSPGEPTPENADQPVRIVSAAPTPRRDVPLWRRILEPDAMSMMIISLTLLVMGIRILWSSGGNNRQGGREKREDASRREDRYARYSGPVPDRDLKKDSVDWKEL